jgi:hypothetical protein
MCTNTSANNTVKSTKRLTAGQEGAIKGSDLLRDPDNSP